MIANNETVAHNFYWCILQFSFRIGYSSGSRRLVEKMEFFYDIDIYFLLCNGPSLTKYYHRVISMHPISEITDDIDSKNFFVNEKPSGRKG